MHLELHFAEPHRNGKGRRPMPEECFQFSEIERRYFDAAIYAI